MINNMVQGFLSKFLMKFSGQSPEKELLNQMKIILKRNLVSQWCCQMKYPERLCNACSHQWEREVSANSSLLT